jgi:hypothetical protein
MIPTTLVPISIIAAIAIVVGMYMRLSARHKP